MSVKFTSTAAISKSAGGSRNELMHRLAMGSASLIALVLFVWPAAAQQQGQDQDQNLETVVVTGSHISTPGFETPIPVTSISQDYLQLTGTVQANTLEFQIPQLTPTLYAQQVAGNPGQTNFNLRGLGATRTLLLIDGLRVMPTSYDGSTDTGIIPVSLIKRVDTVTGGASAAYGSDAVAGVVNVILDNDYEGFKGNAQVGESQYHDNKEMDYSLTYGTAFDGDRGHIVVSGELYSNSGSNFGAGRRPWADQGYALVSNPLYAQGVANGQPQQILISDAINTKESNGGIITSGPLTGIMFGPDGTIDTQIKGAYAGGTFQEGGTGDHYWQDGSLTPVMGRQSLYTHVSYDLSKDLSVWGQLIDIHYVAGGDVTPSINAGNITVNITNPFLPTAVKSLMVADGISSFSMGRSNIDLGFNYTQASYNDVMWATGLKGKLGGTWTWDLTGQYSSNSYYYRDFNNLNTALWSQSYNVISNPAVGGATGIAVGAPICASDLNNANPSCVPINIFGTNTITASQAQHVTGTSWNYWPQEAWDISANLQGVAFSEWAGDVSVAVGGEARRDSIHGVADPTSLAKLWFDGNNQPFTGEEQVEEGYAEADVPLLSHIPLAESVGFNGAFRYTNYSISGSTQTWKLGLNWSINDDVRIRFTNSRDMRAPTLNDLFAASGSTIGAIVDPAANADYETYYGTGGNRNLVPEVGITNTGGVVFSPSWLSGFQASVDYWSIKLHNAIVSPGVQGVINDCLLYNQTSLCSSITRSPTTGLITFVESTEFNEGLISTDGVDFEADYSIDASDVWSRLNGNFTFRAIGTYTDNYLSTVSGVTSQTVGTGDLNKWRGNIDVGYHNDKVDLDVNWRYAGAEVNSDQYVVAPQGGVPNSIGPTNNIGGRYYFNLSAAYVLPGLPNWKVYGDVQNLFNVSPPISANSLFEPQTAGAGNQIFDIIGRDFHIGVRFNY